MVQQDIHSASGQSFRSAPAGRYCSTVSLDTLPQVEREEHVVLHQSLAQGVDLRIPYVGRRQDQRLQNNQRTQHSEESSEERSRRDTKKDNKKKTSEKQVVGDRQRGALVVNVKHWAQKWRGAWSVQGWQSRFRFCSLWERSCPLVVGGLWPRARYWRWAIVRTKTK